MINFKRDSERAHLSAANLPALDDDGLPMTVENRNAPKGPDCLSSYNGITLQAYLSPGPYSATDAKRLLTAIDMLRDLVEERTEQEDSKKRQPRLADVGAAE